MYVLKAFNCANVTEETFGMHFRINDNLSFAALSEYTKIDKDKSCMQ